MKSKFENRFLGMLLSTEECKHKHLNRHQRKSLDNELDHSRIIEFDCLRSLFSHLTFQIHHRA